MRKAFLIAGLAWAGASSFAQDAAPPPAPVAEQRLNVVVLLADDLGSADLSCLGGRGIATPQLDALAGQGVLCTAAYVTAPVCAPSRAALLTGRHQQRFGFEFNLGPPAVDEPARGLPRSETTLAERLRAAGYATGMVGKWHLGDAKGMRPHERGFDEWFGFYDNASHDDPARRRERFKIVRDGVEVKEKEWLTRAFAREAAAFIERHAGGPFFLYVPFSAVHAPIEPDPRLDARVASIKDERERAYANAVVGLDDAVGRVLEALRKADLEARTLVLFLSDNGAIRQASNAPLRGMKTTLFEGGVRVPMIVRCPGRIAPGGRFTHPVSSLDLAATVLAAAGVARDDAMRLDGVDLLPFLSGAKEGPPHAALFWRFGSRFAIRQGDWKLVAARPDATAALYDLAADPGERRDLAQQEPERVAALQAAWDAWNAGNVAPSWAGKEEVGEDE